jgi:hypothetical protein
MLGGRQVYPQALAPAVPGPAHLTTLLKPLPVETRREKRTCHERHVSGFWERAETTRYFVRERRDFFFRVFAACFPRAVRVFFGNRLSVRLRFAAEAAFLTLRFAAIRCFDAAIMTLLKSLCAAFLLSTYPFRLC